MPATTRRSRTILVAEDDAELRELISVTLSEPGYTVFAAADGYEALRILADRPVDLLITDVRMPGISGLELARQAKLMRSYLHVIYVSGYADRDDGPVYGALIDKPVRGSELLAAIDREFNPSSASRPSP